MREKTSEGMVLLSGIGLGAAFMYMFDPDRGRRRRALVRDKFRRVANKAPDAIDVTSRDLKNRARGLAAEVGSMFSESDAPDDVLVERVRSKMGRVVSHPSAIDVTANQGRVTLRGPILADEVDDLLSYVSRVQGVNDVDNQLEVHKDADGVPALQGGRKRLGDRFEFLQENWSPAARLIAGAAGGALTVYGSSRRNPMGIGLAALGTGLLLRGLTNMELRRLFGIGGGRRAVNIQKAININAPVDGVYWLWTNYENFPLFMRNVLEVRDLGNGRSHWKVAGPAGVPVEWDAVVTRQIPNQLFAWKSVEGSLVDHAGMIQFDQYEDGSTRVQVRLSYNPPVGAIGHAVAELFGADPKHEMDEDLMRMKSFIETGVQPHDAAAARTQARGATAR